VANVDQDALFRALGITIVRQDAIELVLRKSDGRCDRFLAKPGVSFVDAERARLDGVYRDGVFYQLSTLPPEGV